MNSNIVISKSTIDEYKNNINLLKGLSLKIKSGSFNAYDIALYKSLVSTNDKEKTLKLNVTA